MKSLNFVFLGLGSLLMCSCQRVKNWGPKKPQCSSYCTLEYKPICAGDPCSDNPPQTFANECQFRLFNCRNPNNQMTYLYEGECTTTARKTIIQGNCPQFCMDIYKPVCAYNKRKGLTTFPNKCYLQVFNCNHPKCVMKYLFSGPCSKGQLLTNQTTSRRKLNPNHSRQERVGNSLTPTETFMNLRQLKLYNRENPRNKLQILNFDKCIRDCDIYCLDVYEPVCGGTPGGYPLMTFSNSCELDVYNCNYPGNELILLYCGKCQFSDRNTKHCSLDYPNGCSEMNTPICVRNQYGNETTFRNPCDLATLECDNDNQDIEFEFVCAADCTACPVNS